MKTIKLALLVTITIGLSNQECLDSETLIKLGLKPNSQPEEYSSGDICSTYYQDTGAKSCVNSWLMEHSVELRAGQWKNNYEAEHYEIYANMDNSFNDFVNGYVEVAQKGTYKGKKVSSTVKSNFETAYSWVEKYGVGDKNVSNEVEACTQAQLNNTFGSYCMLGSDLATRYTGDCPTVQSKSDNSNNNAVSDSGDQDSVNSYNDKINESKNNQRRLSTSEMRVNIDEESTSKLVDACADTVRALCLHYKMQTALSSAQGQSFPQDLKSKCSEDLLACASKVKDKNGVVSTETSCNHKQQSLMVKNFFGGVGNKIIPSATRNAYKVKYSDEKTRLDLYAKLQNHGFGEVKEDSTTKADTGAEGRLSILFFILLKICNIEF